MREKFYGLLREYLATLRERDVCEAQVRALPEGVDRNEVTLKAEVLRKRCSALRREIRRYPDANMPRAAAPDHPQRSYQVSAR
jgi:hypothetical protein